METAVAGDIVTVYGNSSVNNINICFCFIISPGLVRNGCHHLAHKVCVGIKILSAMKCAHFNTIAIGIIVTKIYPR